MTKGGEVGGGWGYTNLAELGGTVVYACVYVYGVSL